MRIEIFDQQSDIELEIKNVKEIIIFIVDELKIKCDEIAFYFVDKKTISKLHLQFFNDPTETDCITLPLDRMGSKPYCFLGEVFVCPSVGIEYALKHNLDPLEEIYLYMIHGLLHLIGYDDIEEVDER